LHQGGPKARTGRPTFAWLAIHGRFVRLFLEHKAEAGVAGLSDEQVVEQAPAIFHRLDTTCQEAAQKGDGAALDRLAWFTRACDEEFDEVREPPPHQPLH